MSSRRLMFHMIQHGKDHSGAGDAQRSTPHGAALQGPLWVIRRHERPACGGPKRTG